MDMIFEGRIVALNNRPVDNNGACVVYWMQRSQRATDNLALEYAVQLANETGVPVLVYFGLYADYPMASARAFHFMLDGLRETAVTLENRGIGFLMRSEHPQEGLPQAAAEFRACAVVVDEDYLNIGRAWRSHAAAKLDMKLIQVDAETIVPARLSGKEEWGAYTLRPKIRRVLESYFVDYPDSSVKHRWLSDAGENFDGRITDPSDISSQLNVDPVRNFAGGTTAGMNRLQRFIEENLPRYASERNQIGVSVSSDLSPYLHFGQLSALRVGLIVDGADADGTCVDAFLEQLIVRRELGINFCLYNQNYANPGAAPDWGQKTVDAHRYDERPEIFTLEELESSSTYDDLWNAAQLELVKFGRIHPYMRMLWAKLILQWSPSPAEAQARCIYLNDKYALDGRDPNGYLNIAWSIFGKADRPFRERSVFGKIRCMTSAATKRKFDWKSYILRVETGCGS